MDIDNSIDVDWNGCCKKGFCGFYKCEGSLVSVIHKMCLKLSVNCGQVECNRETFDEFTVIGWLQSTSRS